MTEETSPGTPEHGDYTRPGAAISFSRTGVVSPTGTLISELKTKVDPDTDIAFRQLCNQAGTDVAGALRNYVFELVHGKSYDALVFESMQRRAVLLRTKGPNEGLKLPVREMPQSEGGIA